MKINSTLLAMLFAFASISASAQLPKLNKGSITKKANSKAKSTVKNTTNDAAQHTQKLNKHNSKLKGLAASANWSDTEFVKDFQYTLGYYATDLARAQADPGGKPAFKKYEPNFMEFLTSYQDNYDLADQRIYPVTKDDEAKKELQSAFRKVVYPYSMLKKREAQEKAKWGDAEWVEEYQEYLSDLDAGISAYRAADAVNQGRVERYEEAKKPLQALYDERKEFPARRKEYSDYINSKERDAKNMKKIAEGGYGDDAKFLESAKNFDFAKNRENVAFLNEWDFSVMSYSMSTNWLKAFTTDWAGETKADLDKAIADAKAKSSSEKYAYSRYMQALRYQNLTEAGALLHPDDKGMAGNFSEAKTLAASKKKEYETETFLSDFHKKNPISMGISSTGAKGFTEKKSLTAGEKFVITLFYDRPIALLYPEGRLVIKMDGPWDEEEGLQFTLKGAELDKSYVDLTIMGSDYADEDKQYVHEKVLRELVRAQGKKGEVKLHTSKLSNIDKRQTSKCSFEFDGTNSAGISKYDAKRIAMTDVRLADVRMPKAAKTDASLAASMKKAFMAHYGDQDVVEVTRVVITGSDWTVQRNEWTGIILSRTIDASVAYKRIDGQCRFEDAGFKQDSQGGGKWGPTYWNGVGDNDEIACKNVNK